MYVCLLVKQKILTSTDISAANLVLIKFVNPWPLLRL